MLDRVLEDLGRFQLSLHASLLSENIYGIARLILTMSWLLRETVLASFGGGMEEEDPSTEKRDASCSAPLPSPSADYG